MLTGKLPLNDSLPRLRGELARFQGLIDRMLAKDPAHRYPDAAAALQALQRAGGGE